MRHRGCATSLRRPEHAVDQRWWASLATTAAALWLLTSVLACQTRPPVHAARAPAPSTDFLLAAGDSTFWVTTGPQGVRVRGSPLLLAHYGGRFYELYVTDEDHSFYNAVFTTQRIYRRDLLTGDSVAVFRDSSVARAARGYAKAHPDDAPLAPDADAAEDPATSVTGEVDIVDVDGPFVSYEYHGSSSTRPAHTSSPDSDEDEAPENETVRRGVVDLRVAKQATLRGLFGAAVADTAAARGRRAFAIVLDSIRAARGAGDVRAGRAAAALGEFAFDARSFSLLDVSREPAIQFFARGAGGGAGLTLPVPPVILLDGDRAPWWMAERETMPVGGADSASDIWTRANVDVIARYDTAGGPDEGQGVALVLRHRRGVAADTVLSEWRVGRFPAPTRRIYWLDTPPADSATRRALARAFDESALYGNDARTVRLPLPVRHQRPGNVVFAALEVPRIASVAPAGRSARVSRGTDRTRDRRASHSGRRDAVSY